jgi:hypothetical protein
MSLVTAKFAQKCRFAINDGITVTNYDFEIDNLQFGFSEIAEMFELWNRKKEKVTLGWRFVANFSSRYLRAAAVGSEIVDVINSVHPKTFLILDIGMSAVPVNILPLANTINIANQKIIPNYDFTVEAIDTVSTVPSWFKFTKAKPGYL